MIPLLAHLPLLQQTLREQKLDGWLLYDFRSSNKPMLAMLDRSHLIPLTRRLFYWVPATGRPRLFRHAIEAAALEELESEHLLQGDLSIFSSYKILEEQLKATLKGAARIAMEVSPKAALPYLSCVDAGTVEWIESLGPRVESSAVLLQEVLARWDQAALDTHLLAARALEEATLAAFAWVHARLAANRETGEEINEWQVSLFIQERLKQQGMEMADLPIVAVEANSANAHYLPTAEHHQPIRANQFLLIDIWCRKSAESSRYADICRVAFTGSEPSVEQKAVFTAVLQAQKAAIELLRAREAAQKPVFGYELDIAARQVITKAGFAPYFTHRLGHSIDLQDHGSGTHLDDFETSDTRKIMTRSCFSIEPGIYFEGRYGLRLESDIYVDSKGKSHITGGMQEELYLLDPEKTLQLPSATSPLRIDC